MDYRSDNTTRVLNFTQNFNRIINNPKYYNEILFPYIEKALEGTLSHSDRNTIIQMIRTTDPKIFIGKSLKEITEDFTNFFAEKLEHTKVPAFDPKEYIKREMGLPSEEEVRFQEEQTFIRQETKKINASFNEIGITKFLNAETPDSFRSIIKKELIDPINVKTVKTYILLDSKYRIVQDTKLRKFSWTYFNSIDTSQGTVNSYNDARNIIAIKVFPFRIPNQSGFFNSGYKKMTMLIEELTSQSSIFHEGNRFHFEFEASVDGNWIDLNPYKVRTGIYEFIKPITNLNTLTVSFGNPINRIEFLMDRLSCIADYNTGIITTLQPHNQVTGNQVIFYDFTTYNSAEETVDIATVNNLEGYSITVLSPTTFSAPIDWNGLFGPQSYYLDVLGTSTITNGSATLSGVGTTYLTGFNNSPQVLISNKNLEHFYAGTITPNTNTSATMANVYNGTTNSDIEIRRAKTGTINVVNGLTDVNGKGIITGVGTLFKSQYSVGDSIVYCINPNTNVPQVKKIISIESDTSMTVESPDNFVVGNDSTTAHFRYKQTSYYLIPNLTFNVYFQSTRIQIPLEIVCLK